MEYSFNEYQYWFKCCGTCEWNVVGSSQPVNVKVENNSVSIECNTDISAEEHTQILNDFSKFQSRPEYLVGIYAPTDPAQDNSLHYQMLLAGAYLIRAYMPCNSIDELRAYESSHGAAIESRLNAMLNWIKATDFYSAPASTRYHESFTGGLAVHSLKVYNKMLELLALPTFSSADVASATIIALTHDWCKINFYESYSKNAKDEASGTWHQELAWKVNQKGVPLGHGVSSLFLVSKFINLSAEEALALRWHMGRWNCCDIEVDELQKANQTCPLVYLMQFADQLACTNY